jgi:tetratricopeptide (TPR) repeat protein
MLADTAKQADLTAFALASHVPVDSLFTAVEHISFSVGQTSLYEDYLLETKAHTPWLKRIVDAYLMRYYAYRRDPQGMITYSKIMLAGNPDSQHFLYTLAQGYLIDGQTEEALNVYRHIVSLDPNALEALLYLANNSLRQAQGNPIARDEALAYFRQAQTIKATPYISDAIARLESMKKK